MYVHNVKITVRVGGACKYSDVHIWLSLWYTHVPMYIHNVRVTARVIYIWALYRHVTNINNLAQTYMSMHTIHNVNSNARVYAHANADL